MIMLIYLQTACHAEPVEALAILPGLQQAKTNSE
jgi:hypothetical protein